MLRRLSVLLALCAACRDMNAPVVTDDAVPPLPPSIAAMSVVQDVPLVTSPVSTDRFPVSASLLGHETFRVDVEGLQRSVTGQFQPGKVRVTFRVRVRNQLERVGFVTPTFPLPPDGGSGLYLFVVQAVATDTPGAVTTAAPNEIVVTAPGGGLVAPSPEWEGPSYDYLRSTACAAGGRTCARYQRFNTRVGASDVSPWETVGFDVDPTVRNIRMRLLLAADLVNVS